ncbi:MAG: helix-turn-helix domain-containing protein, partial [Candidatus Sungbacteria bacterium]|nr:helix-turn-helix domain-containing protein [Candidatus Sungbacteria bacterium]
MEHEQHFGDILRRARESKRLSIHEASDVAKVPPDAIDAFEKGDSMSLPPRVYARGFLHNYIETLGVSADVPLDSYLDLLFPDATKFIATPVAKKPRHMFSRSQVFTGLGVFIAVLVVASYFLFQFRSFVSSTNITLEVPEKDMVITAGTSTVLDVRGHIDPPLRLTLNGLALYS